MKYDVRAPPPAASRPGRATTATTTRNFSRPPGPPTIAPRDEITACGETPHSDDLFGAENPILGEEYHVIGVENPILGEEHYLFGATNPILGKDCSAFGAKSVIWAHKKAPQSIKIVANGVPVARHGLILGEDEAMASRKLFKHLPGPPGPVVGPKRPQK